MIHCEVVQFDDLYLTKKEIEIASKLIQSMSAKWNPKKYLDKYQEAIHHWVEETVNKKPHTQMKQRKHAPAHATIVNFADLLRKSMTSTNKSRHGLKRPTAKSKSRDTHVVKH